MKTSKKRDTCPYCDSDDWIKTYVKDNNGYRSSYNAEIIFCRDCEKEFSENELIPGETLYYIYPGYSFSTPDEALADLKKKLEPEELLNIYN